MTLKQRSHTEATLGTILVMALLFLLLWLVTMVVPTQEEEEGIEVAFGVADDGGGYQQEQSEAVPQVTAKSAPSQSAPTDNDLLTQDSEESLALQKKREEDAKRKAEQAELNRQKREAEARAEAERLAKEKALAEQRAKEQDAINKANALGSLFGNNGSTATGSGDGQGDTQKGNPVGHGSSGGATWSLAGRGMKAMPKPAQDFQESGKVVVDILVDADGNVINAKAGASGTNTSSAVLLRLAEEAARKAKFTSSDNPQNQRGTITYNFVLK